MLINFDLDFNVDDIPKGYHDRHPRPQWEGLVAPLRPTQPGGKGHLPRRLDLLQTQQAPWSLPHPCDVIREKKTSAAAATVPKNDGNENECSDCETDHVIQMIVSVGTICVGITFLVGLFLGSWWFNGLDRPIRFFIMFYFFYHILPAASTTIKRIWAKGAGFSSELERLDGLDHANFMDSFLNLVEVYVYDRAFGFNRVRKYNVEKCTGVGMDEGLLIVRLRPYPDLYSSPKLTWLNNLYLNYQDR